MTKLTKFFLTVSLSSFAVGAVVCFSKVNVHPSWTVAMPVGAIFFGLFLNAYILEGEAAKFDAEELSRLELAKRYENTTTEISTHTEVVPATAALCALH